MASDVSRHARERERSLFLARALGFEDICRQAAARVQFVKSRYQKAFDPDEDNYSLYLRSKRLLSKLEYAQRQMQEQEAQMHLALRTRDTKAYKVADKKYEGYMMKCLYCAFGIGQLYTKFIEEAPSGALS